MPEERLRLDPANPGMFYACCGVLEIASRHEADVLGRFEMKAARSAEFILESAGSWVEQIGEAVREVDVRECAVAEGLETIRPVELVVGRLGGFRLSWWMDWVEGDKSTFKMWAGQQTSGGILRELAKLGSEPLEGGLLGGSIYTQTKLGVDPRPAWNALDCGYSPNEHKASGSPGYPVTELLAAIGLQGFRPGVRRRDLGYALWEEALPLAAARWAASGGWAVRASRYKFEIEQRGKYGCFGYGTRTEE